MNIFDHAVAWLVGHPVETVLTIVITVAKAFSNTTAGWIVGTLQKGVDLLAKSGRIISSLGTLITKIGEIIENVIKSDGFLGKK